MPSAYSPRTLCFVYRLMQAAFINSNRTQLTELIKYYIRAIRNIVYERSFVALCAHSTTQRVQRLNHYTYDTGPLM